MLHIVAFPSLPPPLTTPWLLLLSLSLSVSLLLSLRLYLCLSLSSSFTLYRFLNYLKHSPWRPLWMCIEHAVALNSPISPHRQIQWLRLNAPKSPQVAAPSCKLQSKVCPSTRAAPRLCHVSEQMGSQRDSYCHNSGCPRRSARWEIERFSEEYSTSSYSSLWLSLRQLTAHLRLAYASASK